MKRTQILFVFLVSFFVVSCIPNKDLIYLQNQKESNANIEVLQSNMKPYRVQSNDILNISIKALDKELVSMFAPTSTETIGVLSAQQLYFDGFSVDLHGNIKVPVLGNINVLGLTTEEIGSIIEKKLVDDYFKTEARIFIVVKLAGLRYTINGEVGAPGTNTLFQDNATIMEAIANSGDITITGNRKEVQVIRKFPQGYETFVIDLTNAEAYKSPVFNIQPNDYIYIKPLKQKSWGTGTTGIQSLSTIITALSLITTTILLTRNL